MAMHDCFIFGVDTSSCLQFFQIASTPPNMDWTHIQVVVRLGKKSMVVPVLQNALENADVFFWRWGLGGKAFMIIILELEELFGFMTLGELF